MTKTPSVNGDRQQCKPLPREDLDHVLRYTRESWSEARGASFFITGGTGFFGMWLLESFAHVNDALKLGMRATVLTRDFDRFRKKAPHLADREDLSFVEGDVRNFSFPEGEFRYVIHGATTSGAPVDDLEMLETIVDGTRHILNFAASGRVQKFLYISSGAVYGRQPPELKRVSEDYEGAPNSLEPNSAYGEGKRVGELLCLLKSKAAGFEVKIARCFAFVGPHLPLNAHFAIGNFLRDALKGDPIVVNNGVPVRSYLYAADLAVWLWTILFKGQAGAAYNVGSDESICIADLARLMAKLFDIRVEESFVSTDGKASYYVPSVARVHGELGLEVQIGLTDAIDRTARWHGCNLEMVPPHQ